MKSESLLQIKQINANKQKMNKKVLGLPILTVQTQSTTKKRGKQLQPQIFLNKRKKSLSQMLNIIQHPHRKDNNHFNRITKGRSSVQEKTDRSQRIVSLLHQKKYSSLDNDDFRGQLRQAMQLLLQKRKERIKTTGECISPFVNRSTHLIKNQWSSPSQTVEKQNLVGSKIRLFDYSDKRKVINNNTFRLSILKKEGEKNNKYQKLRKSKELKQKLKRKSKLGDFLSGWNEPKDTYKNWKIDSEDNEYQSLQF